MQINFTYFLQIFVTKLNGDVSFVKRKTYLSRSKNKILSTVSFSSILIKFVSRRVGRKLFFVCEFRENRGSETHTLLSDSYYENCVNVV